MSKVKIAEYPTDKDWIEVKKRALVTIGKSVKTTPDMEWKQKMLQCRHSPIRRLFFSFEIECPYWVTVHLARHVHAQPYIRSQRNDRQSGYDRNSAPQNETVSMIWDMNAEELITIANKRLCKQASIETSEVVSMMCEEVVKVCPEFKGELVPMCARNGRCYEFKPCKRGDENV